MIKIHGSRDTYPQHTDKVDEPRKDGNIKTYCIITFILGKPEKEYYNPDTYRTTDILAAS